MKEEIYKQRNSSYCYENSDTLINLLNIKDNKLLQKYEAKITAAKLLNLRQKKITGNFDVNHFIRLLEELAKENFLSGIDKKQLAQRLAYYISEFNVLHPFREGNGRTIREFIRQLALKNGYILNLKKVSPQEMFKASIKSIIDTTDLEKLIEICLEKKPNLA